MIVFATNLWSGLSTFCIFFFFTFFCGPVISGHSIVVCEPWIFKKGFKTRFFTALIVNTLTLYFNHNVTLVCRKRGKKGEKGGKGLRHFSMKVCEKVQKKGVTSYNEVADELVHEFSDPRTMTPTDQVSGSQVSTALPLSCCSSNWCMLLHKSFIFSLLTIFSL